MAVSFMLSGSASAACPSITQKNVLDVRLAKRAIVEVCARRVLREQLPATLFGFNVHHHHFEKDIWDAETAAVPLAVTAALEELPGALYRYPGGLVSNRFAWEASVGPPHTRDEQRSVKWAPAAPVLFGLDEYLNFVDSVDGQPWFVLNLAGWNEQSLFTELDKDVVAASNGRLATHMLEHIGADTTRFYQLGNELDRAQFQWPHKKYIDRARSTIEAILKVDPDARIVAFLREFDWIYKGDEKAREVSRYQDFIRDVLTGLPEVNDFSMHFYYDAPNADKDFKFLPWRLRQFRRAIEVAAEVREGRTPNVWITEHARGIEFGKVKARDARPYTSNLSAAISTADFLIALAQLPEVQGASWHGLNAMPWEVFDPRNNLQPNPVYWAMRVLRMQNLPQVLATYTSSPNNSGYGGGYDIRAAAFGAADGTTLGAWFANRSVLSAPVEFRVASWANREVKIEHHFISGEVGRNPDQPGVEAIIELSSEARPARFSSAGVLLIELPSSSVSSLTITLAD